MDNIYHNIISRIMHFSIGLSLIIILSLLISKNIKNIQIRYIIQVLIIEIIIGYFILHSTIGLESIQKICYLFDTLLFFASKGTNFVFGDINTHKTTSIFFLNVLCPIIFISSIIGILQYSHILIHIINTIGILLSKISGMGKLESFNIISSLILGQSENFIIYKDIIAHISEPRIYTMAATAMSTVSLSMISVYMTMLNPKYVIAALLLNMFSTIIILSLINPYTINPEQDLYIPYFITKNNNFFTIIGEYILIGFNIATTVAAMLIGFIALITATNTIFKIIFGISLQHILSYIFLPFTWTIGIPIAEILPVSKIMATKLITNEFVAMIDLQKILHTLSTRSIGILSIFLVSFSNFTSIGIIIGTITKLNTTQGKIIAHYGLRLIYSSTLVNLLSATIASLIL
ncbi:nucleoside permease NupC [Candidatus Blochmanniella floridana]|uniref:Nucleoside permease NupC n=2 Tax=cellular organisms TaxID=131567 RepID=Q7VRU4_BLOFL|nr:nucleoside permease NupC [Candidatus Blochmannia floridanus]